MRVIQVDPATRKEFFRVLLRSSFSYAKGPPEKTVFHAELPAKAGKRNDQIMRRRGEVPMRHEELVRKDLMGCASRLRHN